MSHSRLRCIPSVFDQQCKEHSRFAPVLHWITFGRGRLIYGESKYKRELSKLPKYIPRIVELNRQGRLIELQGEAVDAAAMDAKAKVKSKKFNDEHIVGMVVVSGCRIVCTDDKESYPFLKRRDLYPKGVKLPKIYNGRRHATLCCNQYLVSICRS